MSVSVAAYTHPVLLPFTTRESMYVDQAIYRCGYTRAEDGSTLVLEHRLSGCPLLSRLITSGKAQFGVKLRSTMKREALYCGDQGAVKEEEDGTLTFRQEVDLSGYSLSSDTLRMLPVIALKEDAYQEEEATEEGTGIQEWYLDEGKVSFPPYAVLAKAKSYEEGPPADPSGKGSASLASLCAVRPPALDQEESDTVELNFDPSELSSPFTLKCQSKGVYQRFARLMSVEVEDEDADQRMMVNFLLASCYAAVDRQMAAKPEEGLEEIACRELRDHCVLMQKKSQMEFGSEEFDVAKMATAHWHVAVAQDEEPYDD